MVFNIESLYIYPVKSLAGIRVKKAKVLPEGFMHDRRWMLVDKNGSFVSQRSAPILALFKSQLKNEHLIITYKDEQLKIPLFESGHEYRDIKVWDDRFKGQEISAEASEWFADQLNTSVSLVYYGNDSNRVKEIPKMPFKIKISFADGYPYLLLGTASMNLLNSKLKSPILTNRFRPNILVRTHIPHIEDDWNNIDISKVAFKNIKPCARCIMPTINQETGELGKEPLKTLSTYRKESNNIYFGTNLIALNNGVIREGDIVNISLE